MMAILRIDESKYSLESRLSLVSASTNVKKMIEEFNKRIFHSLPKIFAITHVRGLTYFVTPTKAFIFLNIRQDYLSVKIFTGKASIEGLKEGNWSRGDDRSGSETFRIQDEKDLKMLSAFL
jgi:hypothetical protein